MSQVKLGSHTHNAEIGLKWEESEWNVMEMNLKNMMEFIAPTTRFKNYFEHDPFHSYMSLTFQL